MPRGLAAPSASGAMTGFTLRQLEIFALVVEHGSFRRCADHLGVNQVSVSEHVRELENRLGARLFDRTAGGAPTLTRAGEQAYRRIAAILADLDDLTREIGGGPPRGRRRLVVSMYPYVMRYVRDALAAFKGRHPELDVAVDFEPALPHRVHQRLQARELDVAYFISLERDEVPPSEIARIEPLAIFVARDHPLAQAATATAAEIRRTPAIHLGPRNPQRIAVDRALERAGMAGSPVAIEADQFDLLLTSVARGDGFACMFASLAAEVAESPGLVALRLEQPLASLEIRQMTRQPARHDDAMRELIAAFGAALKSLAAPGFRYER
jgi:DNA-binding transcriptional LysR family regulator